jgi:hypothetical protein
MTGADKSGCLDTAKSAHVAAVNDAKKAARWPMPRRRQSARLQQCDGADKVVAKPAQTPRDTMADTMITTKVKTELLARPSLKSLDVRGNHQWHRDAERLRAIAGRGGQGGRCGT